MMLYGRVQSNCWESRQAQTTNWRQRGMLQVYPCAMVALGCARQHARLLQRIGPRGRTLCR